MKPLVSLVRGARDRLLYQGRPLVFVHVPKSGGTSINQAVARRIGIGTRLFQPVPSYKAAFKAGQLLGGASASQAGLRDDTSLHAFLLAYHLSAGWRYVGGHFPVNEEILDEFGQTHDFVTVIREPVDRWISHYLYNKTLSFDSDMKPSPRFEGAIEDEFAEVISGGYGLLYGSTSTTMLSGVRPSSPEHALELASSAVSNMARFSAVGVSDELQLFTTDLAELLGSSLKLRHTNRTAPRFAEREEEYIAMREFFQGPDVRAAITDLCPADHEVYRAAKDMVETRE